MNSNFFSLRRRWKECWTFCHYSTTTVPNEEKKSGNRRKVRNRLHHLCPVFCLYVYQFSCKNADRKKKFGAENLMDHYFDGFDFHFDTEINAIHQRLCGNDCAKNETIVKLCYSVKTNIELPFIWWKLCAEQKKIYNNVAIIVLRDSIHTNC